MTGPIAAWGGQESCRAGLCSSLEHVRSKVESVSGITTANVNLVFEPAWDQSMMSEEARVELGFD